MKILYYILLGITGGFLGTLPVSFSGHILFLKKVNTTLSGTAPSVISSSVVFTVYFGIFCGILLVYHERIIQLFITLFETLKEMFSGKFSKNSVNAAHVDLIEYFVCLLFYIPAAVYAALYENSGYSNILLSVLLCVTVFVDFFVDFVPQINIKKSVGIIITAFICAVSSFGGLSELAGVFFIERLFGKRPGAALRTAFTLYIPIALTKSVIYLIGACEEGFYISLFEGLCLWIFSAFGACLTAGIVKKAALKKNFKAFAYYTAVFTAILIYTFLKG